jgi:UDP-N-acetyl-2-amino-2-deoxyglucuronate dehydrogenase
MGDYINFGIIGCGAISEKHGQAMAQVEGARLVAVADVVEERARAFAGKYLSETALPNGHDKVYLDYRAMLEDSDVDAVIVATPSGLHAKMGLDVLDAGKHVLIEKPLALTSRDAQLLIDKAQSVGKCLGTVHPNRYYPTSQMIYRAIRDGRLGKLSHGVATVRWNRRASYYDEAPWRKTREMDGGILFNQAWHAFDALLWYMGSPVVDVQAMTATRFHDVETEDVAIVNLGFENGALGLVEATTNIYPKNLEHSVSIFGETGTICQGGARVDELRVWKVCEEDDGNCLHKWGDQDTVSRSSSWAHTRVLCEFSRILHENNTPCSERTAMSDCNAVLQALELIRTIERALVSSAD